MKGDLDSGERAAARLRALLEGARQNVALARARAAWARPGGPAWEPLERAAESLRHCPALLRQADPPSRPALRAMIRDLESKTATLRALLEYTASFYSGWISVLGGMQQGYTPLGAPAPPLAPRRVFLEG